MSPDALAELALIDLSRLQREVLERWTIILVDAGEPEHAEAVRQAITEQDMASFKSAA